MRLCWWSLNNDFSGDFIGRGLIVYALSRALAARASAAAATFLEVFGLVVGLVPGFRGNGGGARSGSELSHLFAVSESTDHLPSHVHRHAGATRFGEGGLVLEHKLTIPALLPVYRRHYG